MTLAAGTRLGPYEISGPIGAGGMGVVYRARDPRLGRDVAIKVLPSHVSENESRLDRFEQEARAASALNHPNVLSVFDVGTYEGAPYIVSELLEGETLASRMASGPIPVRKVVQYAMQMGKGLAAAHAKGIVHRDLKPANLFLTQDGGVKILDFGLAKLVESPLSGPPASESPTASRLTESGVILGTVGYMSPEQVRGERIDGRSDLFALGAILYEMLSGRPAFHRPTTAETMHEILKADPPALEDGKIPTTLTRLVEHCLEKDPDERFQSARDLVFDLETLATLSGPTTAARAPSRKTRSLLVASASALLAVAFFAGREVGERTSGAVPAYHRLTFRPGFVHRARFAPDGETIFYSATWLGTGHQLYSTRQDSPEARVFQPDTDILAISPSGEMAVAVEASRVVRRILGTLALMPISGAAPRPILENVSDADWPREGGALAVLHVVDGRSRIEFPIGNVLYETDASIAHIRVSPGGDWIAFAELESSGLLASIAVLDRSGQKKVLSRGWWGLLGLCWSPRGDEVWFVGTRRGVYGSTRGVSLDGRERLVAWGMEVEDVSPDGKALFIRRSSHKGVVFLSSDGSEERDLSWLDWSTVNDISRDGQWLLFSEQGEGGGSGGWVYLRKTDGAPAVRLGKGGAQALSPDGAFALAIRREGVRSELVLLPTGVGEEETLTAGEAEYIAADWFPDGGRFVLVLAQKDNGERSWVLERGSGVLHPITPEGVSGTHVTPDGEWLLAARPGEKPLLYPVPGGEPRSVPGLGSEDTPVEWSEDGRFLYVRRDSWEYPYKVALYRLNVTTGDRALVREYVPEDVRVSEVLPLVMTPDARFLAYTYARIQLDLYLAEGLR